MARKILHLDLDAFFCAVEEQLDASLRGKAFAVGGRPDQRGVIASCSYPARKFGVHSAMPSGQALRLCPELILVRHRHHVYSQVSEKVMQRLYDLTPMVEQISIDEAFIDASDLPESASEIANRLQARILDELDLPCSIGAASNKLVAKIANDVGKAAARGLGKPPSAITVVPPGQEAAFLAPLPVDALWGIGPKTAQKLQAIGIQTIGDLAQKPPAELTAAFGKLGQEFSLHAQGIDERPLITFHEPKSVSRETTYVRDVAQREQLVQTLKELSESVSRNLKREARFGATVKIKLRWSDFTTLTRQATLSQPTADAGVIYHSALALFDAAWKKNQPVRLIGVGVSNLCPQVQQLSLFDPMQKHLTPEQEQKLQTAISDLRKRFGDHILQQGEIFKEPPKKA